MTIEEIKGINPWDLISQIRWLVKRVKELEEANDIWKRQNATLFQQTLIAEERVRVLEEGINRHKESLTQPIKESYVGCRYDNELYKLLEKGEKIIR